MQSRKLCAYSQKSTSGTYSSIKKTTNDLRKVPSCVSTSYTKTTKATQKQCIKSTKSTNTSDSTKKSNGSTVPSKPNCQPNDTGVATGAKTLPTNCVLPKKTNLIENRNTSAKVCEKPACVSKQKMKLWKCRNDSSQIKQALSDKQFKPIYTRMGATCKPPPKRYSPPLSLYTIYQPPVIFRKPPLKPTKLTNQCRPVPKSKPKLIKKSDDIKCKMLKEFQNKLNPIETQVLPKHWNTKKKEILNPVRLFCGENTFRREMLKSLQPLNNFKTICKCGKDYAKFSSTNDPKKYTRCSCDESQLFTFPDHVHSSRSKMSISRSKMSVSAHEPSQHGSRFSYYGDVCERDPDRYNRIMATVDKILDDTSADDDQEEVLSFRGKLDFSLDDIDNDDESECECDGDSDMFNRDSSCCQRVSTDNTHNPFEIKSKKKKRNDSKKNKAKHLNSNTTSTSVDDQGNTCTSDMSCSDVPQKIVEHRSHVKGQSLSQNRNKINKDQDQKYSDDSVGANGKTCATDMKNYNGVPQKIVKHRSQVKGQSISQNRNKINNDQDQKYSDDSVGAHGKTCATDMKNYNGVPQKIVEHRSHVKGQSLSQNRNKHSNDQEQKYSDALVDAHGKTCATDMKNYNGVPQKIFEHRSRVKGQSQNRTKINNAQDQKYSDDEKIEKQSKQHIQRKTTKDLDKPRRSVSKNVHKDSKVLSGSESDIMKDADFHCKKPVIEILRSPRNVQSSSTETTMQHNNTSMDSDSSMSNIVSECS
ncbi:hypothetical protein M8J76_000751 [Diaphorina citri]|nr:hypothetical protein M8J76_000751 [Diaphorina citri]